jgi:hydroxymethylpyrimidine/phosphomethylpyrimidine kinase
VTPNLPEALALVGSPGAEPQEDERLLHAILELGPRAVLVTGGHRDEATDLLLRAGGEVVEIPGVRHESRATHGSGCTHSASLAAALALGLDLLAAARYAREAAGDAVRDGLADIGAGAGPVDVLGITRRRLT